MIKISPRNNLTVVVLLPIVWVMLSTSLALSLSLYLIFNSGKFKEKGVIYSVYAAKPLVLGDSTSSIGSSDSRSSSLNQLMEAYDCPLAGFGDKFVSEAEKNGIPYWFVAAISFQESNCGRKIPSDSYNAWGYGIYGGKVHKFDSWEDGIATVSLALKKYYFDQGLSEPCEIMKKYTPPSNGSWCDGIEFFKDKILNFKTPL